MQVIANVDSPISAQIARSIAEAYAADLQPRPAVRGDGDPRAGWPRLDAAAGDRRAGRARVRQPALRSRSATCPPRARSSTRSRSSRPGWRCSSCSSPCSSASRACSRSEPTGRSARLLAAPIRPGSILGGKLVTSFVLGRDQHDRADRRHDPAVRRVVGESDRRGDAGRGRDPGRHRDHGADRDPGEERRAGRQLADRWWPSSSACWAGRSSPSRRLPGVLSTLTFVAPQAWFLRGLGDLRGGGLSVIVVPALAMLAFAAVTGAIAMVRLRRIAEL